MDSLSGRARFLVIAAFVLSAALMAAAAVAFVIASRDDGVEKTAGTDFHPSVIIPTGSPSASPTPSRSASPAAAAPTASPTPSRSAAPASPSASPAARATTSPKPAVKPRPTKTAAKPGLLVDAVLDPADGDTVATVTDFVLSAHATDGDGTIKLQSVTWGDGSKSTVASKQTECASTGTGDCKDFVLHHTYNRTGRFEVYLTVVSGPKAEKSVLHITAFVNRPAPTPSPTSGS